MPSDKATAAIGLAIVGGAVAAAVVLKQAKGATGVASIVVNQVNPKSGAAPLHVEVSGSALDSKGNGVQSVKLAVMVDGSQISSVVTDNMGNFDAALSFTQAGTFNVYVQTGTITSNKTAVSVSGGGTPPPPPTTGTANITIAADKTSAAVNEKITVNGVSLDANSKGISGQTLYLYVDGAVAQHTTTDSNGTYGFTLSFTNPGSYSVFVADQ